MRRSKAEIYLRFVWATYRRLPLITPGVEPLLYEVLQREAEYLGCQVLALGGMPDHVHLAIRMPAKHAPSQVMKQIKGASSAWARANLRSTQPISAEPFGWQDGYGVFSLSRPHLPRVIGYVENQKVHHAENRLWLEWEEIDEDTAINLPGQ